MPFYEQGSLEDAIVESGPQPWREASAWVGQVARTLADAHAHGVLHRVKSYLPDAAHDGNGQLPLPVGPPPARPEVRS